MKKTLHLNLKRKWFDMILSGEKKEEYREIKDYYTCRVIDFTKEESTIDYITDLILSVLSIEQFYKKQYDTITFSNGYKKDRPQFEIELKNIKIGSGKTEWGAIEDEKYFVLELGEIINKEKI